MDFYFKVKNYPKLMKNIDDVLTSKPDQVKDILEEIIRMIQGPGESVSLTSQSDTENYKTFIQLLSKFGRHKAHRDYALSCLEKLSD